jgi:hypothetical protein
MTSEERMRAALEDERKAIAAKAREWARHYPPHSDGRNTFVLLAEWIDSRAACEYCGPGVYTGLPGNACENCMNTGDRDPEKRAELEAALASPPADQVGEVERCKVTGNPVGTYTWDPEKPCPCAPCRYAAAERVCDSYAAENQRLFDHAEAAEARAAALAEGLREARGCIKAYIPYGQWKERVLTRIDALLAPDAAQARDAEERS